jgi:hypothetical protein
MQQLIDKLVEAGVLQKNEQAAQTENARIPDLEQSIHGINPNSKFQPESEAAFWAVSPLFRSGEPCWEDEKISLFPVCTDWEDRCFPEAAVTFS